MRTGDRMSVCRGMMEPVAIWAKNEGEWSVIHRCVKCGFMRTNRISGDDNRDSLIRMVVKPAANPPFPLDLNLIISSMERL